MVNREKSQKIGIENLGCKKEISLRGAYTILICIIASILICVIWQLPIHSAIFMALFISASGALLCGWKWTEVQNMILNGINESLVLLLLMPLIGIVIGLWVVSGIVPSMVYYGVSLLTPKTFLILAPIFTALVAMSIGTSWGTASTIGLAMMSIGMTMGIKPELLAATLIGALFCGEIMSPLAGSANLTVSLMNVELSKHFKKLKVPALLAFGFSLVFNLWWIAKGNISPINTTAISEVLSALSNNYVIHWSLLLIPVIIIFLSWRGVKIIPVLSIGVIFGAAAALLYQDVNYQEILATIYSGPASIDGHYITSALTNNGGIESMMSICILLLMSLGLGGILEHTGALKAAMSNMFSLFNNKPLYLILFTLSAGVLISMVAGSQALAIMLLVKLVSKAYDEVGISRSWGSVAVSASAAVIPPLIPWNVNGLFLTRVLGVQTLEYMKYSVFCFSMPIIVIVWYVIYSKMSGGESIESS